MRLFCDRHPSYEAKTRRIPVCESCFIVQQLKIAAGRGTVKEQDYTGEHKAIVFVGRRGL